MIYFILHIYLFFNTVLVLFNLSAISFKQIFIVFFIFVGVVSIGLLYKHLIKFYNITDEKYQLVHSESYNDKFTLNINQDLDSIYVEKDSDIFKNIFLYTKVIENAKEIHCINSSFAHLVDRFDTKGKLIYHDVRGGRLKFKKKWNYIDY